MTDLLEMESRVSVSHLMPVLGIKLGSSWRGNIVLSAELPHQPSDHCFCGKTLEAVVIRGPANTHHLQILSGTDLLYLRDTHPRMEGLRNATVWVLLVLCLRCLGSEEGGHLGLPLPPARGLPFSTCPSKCPLISPPQSSPDVSINSRHPGMLPVR